LPDTVHDVLPESFSDDVLRVVALSTDNVQGEVGRRWNPKFLRKEKRLGEHDAPDIRVLLRTYGHAAILRDSPAALLERIHTISYSESFPGQAQRKRNELREEAATGNEVTRRMKLEKQRLTGVEGFEGRIWGWLPEVDLFDRRLGGMYLEPVIVRNSHEESHAFVSAEILYELVHANHVAGLILRSF